MKKQHIILGAAAVLLILIAFGAMYITNKQNMDSKSDDTSTTQVDNTSNEDTTQDENNISLTEEPQDVDWVRTEEPINSDEAAG